MLYPYIREINTYNVSTCLYSIISIIYIYNYSTETSRPRSAIIEEHMFVFGVPLQNIATGSLPPAERRQSVIVETLTVHVPGMTPYIEPFRICWYDMRKWEIERIYGHEVVGSEGGREVVRWRILIRGVPKYLYQRDTEWFVIPKRPAGRLP